MILTFMSPDSYPIHVCDYTIRFIVTLLLCTTDSHYCSFSISRFLNILDFYYSLSFLSPSIYTKSISCFEVCLYWCTCESSSLMLLVKESRLTASLFTSSIAPSKIAWSFSSLKIKRIDWLIDWLIDCKNVDIRKHLL